MKLGAIAAAIAVIAVPIAVQGAEGPARVARPEKRTCQVFLQTGSRLGGVRRCRSKSERDAEKAESRNVVERIQSGKNLTEDMANMGVRGMCRSSPRGC
ncbi:MAG TPA: hypothetical protein VEX35_12685 [Allosphingosinicella sp.]|nr:hypothetical protein [Allosphingosinicella sp.]